jgi:hypothetical protein
MGELRRDLCPVLGTWGSLKLAQHRRDPFSSPEGQHHRVAKPFLRSSPWGTCGRRPCARAPTPPHMLGRPGGSLPERHRAVQALSWAGDRRGEDQGEVGQSPCPNDRHEIGSLPRASVASEISPFVAGLPDDLLGSRGGMSGDSHSMCSERELGPVCEGPSIRCGWGTQCVISCGWFFRCSSSAAPWPSPLVP